MELSKERYKELYGNKPKNQLGQLSESEEQKQLFQWANWKSGKYPELELLYHIPNGGLRNKAVATKLKIEGVKSGVPDICLPIARGNYNALYIELKVVKGGCVSDNQKAWLNKLRECGNLAVVCKGFDDAKDTIINYLKLKERVKC
ncbi:MAG: VRR-NUC domain-containing protein [Oscillospiraceae bacterium]